MSFGYSPEPANTRDKVRLLIGDTDTTNADKQIYQDSELDMIINHAGGDIYLAAGLAMLGIASSKAKIATAVSVGNNTFSVDRKAAPALCRAQAQRFFKMSEESNWPEEEEAPIEETGVAYNGMTLSSGFRAFAKNSPWNTLIPDNPPLDPNSSAMITWLDSYVPKLGYNILKWTATVHSINQQWSPMHDVHGSSMCFHIDVDPDMDNLVVNMPLPDEVWPDPESDGHMIVVDESARICWEYSKFHVDSVGQRWASSMGIWDLDGLGYTDPFTGTCWWAIGACGSGMPMINGIIRYDEVKSGAINHAIGCAIPIGRLNELSWPPAARTDGNYAGNQYPPMGARFQLDPSYDISVLDDHVQIVAKAMQDYGMFYMITTAANFNLYFQNLGDDGGAWTEYGDFNDLFNIPVSSFRVLECNIVSKP